RRQAESNRQASYCDPDFNPAELRDAISNHNKASLELFVNSEPGIMEKIEDLVALRFFENGCPMHYTLVESNSLSVDTPKDLEKVRILMKNILNNQ
ncbi:MAG: hypothetical protein J6V36_00855, partial [Clostridia bacterium]|nr:hypothetical protein [Clostridia bacterium]